MKVCIYLLFSLCVGYLHAQIGFNKSFDFENLGAGFSSIELSNDTITVYGLVVAASTNLTGLLFSQIDSFGNVISSSTYFDKDGDNFTRPYQNSLIRLSDSSGFVAIGQLLNKTNGYFIKYNNKAEVVLYKEFIDTVFTFNHFKQIIEIDRNSFLIVGNEAYKETDLTNGFVIKIDSVGEVIWERKYYDPSKITFLGSIARRNENSYLLGGLRTDPGSVSTAQRKYSSLLLEIDSLGTLIKSWNTNYSLNELGIGDMELSELGHIVYGSLRGNYSAEYDQMFTQPLLVTRDSDFNLLNTKTFGEISPYPHNISSIHFLNNSDLLTVGAIPIKYPLPPKTEPINSLSGWINRFNESQGIIWTFIDTAYWSNKSGSNNVLYDAVELSSGSIIACGYNRTSEPIAKDWGWLVKMSKNGCIDTLDCKIVDVQNAVDFDIEIFPNPANDLVIFSSKNPNLSIRDLSIFDVNGLVVANIKGIYTPFQWKCDSVSRGIYLYKILTATGSFVTGVIILI